MATDASEAVHLRVFGLMPKMDDTYSVVCSAGRQSFERATDTAAEVTCEGCHRAAPYLRDHVLVGSSCSCGGWTAPLGTSVWRGYDRHLLVVREG